jgi:hypothetical protein
VVEFQLPLPAEVTVAAHPEDGQRNRANRPTIANAFAIDCSIILLLVFIACSFVSSFSIFFAAILQPVPETKRHPPHEALTKSWQVPGNRVQGLRVQEICRKILNPASRNLLMKNKSFTRASPFIGLRA